MVSKTELFAKREEFLKRFESMNGGLLCSDLIGVRIIGLDDMIKRSVEGIYLRCPGYCLNAISILDDLL